MKMLCNRCDVALQIDHQEKDDTMRVHCPVCGADFGPWQNVRHRMATKVDEPYRDRDSWRSVPE
ncbi:hypothetical protein [Pararhizobium mangrovi]|nr:hypothetical protein [Pararhizobium mangrovi]